MEQVWVEAPASSANLGPGFDAFALALERPADRVCLRKKPSRPAKPSVKIVKSSGLKLPSVEGGNIVGVVCMEIAKKVGAKVEIEVELEKRVPIGKGMGSSGASAAAAAFAMNELLGLGLSADELVYFAGKGEGAASGSAHYDNVAASLLGGFVLVRGGARPSAIRFDPPRSLAVCVATPTVRLPKRKTEYARSLVPSLISIASFVTNMSNASLMVAGMASKDVGLIGAGMVDVIVEPARKKMIPGYDSVRSSALKAGAAGVCISGAGPSMLALVDKKKNDPRRVLEAMRAGFKKGGVESTGYVTRVGEGARVV